jgi:metal-responsive CopG/Arc/MetJ family transcriptional regulator
MISKRMYPVKKLLSLSAEQDDKLRAYKRERGIESESELIRQAVIKYIEPDYGEETLKLSGIKDIQKDIRRLNDMLSLMFIYMRKMNESFFAYHPEIDDTLKSAALQSAKIRNDRFFESFKMNIQQDSSFFEQLLHTYFTENT